MATRFGRFLAARTDRTSEVGLRLTINVVIAAAAVWAFAGLLDEVLERDALVRWDAAVEAWFHVHATPAGLAIFHGITQLGSPGVAVVGLVGAGVLYARHHRAYLWLWIGAIVGGWAVQAALKHFVHRTRPEYAMRYIHGGSYSFPSGHTMSSTIAYGMLAHLVARLHGARGVTRTLVYASAAAIIAGVGFSRLYLGVHFPSDVVGGLLAGAGWSGACIAVERIVVERYGHTDGVPADATRPDPSAS